MAKVTKSKPQQNAGSRYFREVWSEMSRVVWPSREQTINLTLIVVAVMIAMGIFLGVLDLTFEAIIEFVIRSFG